MSTQHASATKEEKSAPDPVEKRANIFDTGPYSLIVRLLPDVVEKRFHCCLAAGVLVRYAG
jgi:hypothetical protein